MILIYVSQKVSLPNCMFETTLHQVVQDRGGPNQILANGPIKADNPQKCYLGSGYYFWDDNVELAKWYGNKYTSRSGNIIICEGDFSIERNSMFDLVGCRQDQRKIIELIKEFWDVYWEEYHLSEEIENIELSVFLEMLFQEAEVSEENFFSYECVRAVDISFEDDFSEYDHAIEKFVIGKPGFAVLSPKIIICIRDLKKTPLQNFFVKYPSKYVK